MNNTKKFPSYTEILNMKNGEEAVVLLFERAQEDYENLFDEMAHHEKLQQDSGIPPSDCGELFLGEKGKNSLELYLKARSILGKDSVIKNHNNLFFDPMFYKFSSDHKRLML